MTIKISNMKLLWAMPFLLLPILAQAAPHTSGPEAGGRSNASNYKDMVLADCIATAYQSAPKIAEDAGSSAGLRWGQYRRNR